MYKEVFGGFSDVQSLRIPKVQNNYSYTNKHLLDICTINLTETVAMSPNKEGNKEMSIRINTKPLGLKEIYFC